MKRCWTSWSRRSSCGAKSCAGGLSHDRALPASFALSLPGCFLCRPLLGGPGSYSRWPGRCTRRASHASPFGGKISAGAAPASFPAGALSGRGTLRAQLPVAGARNQRGGSRHRLPLVSPLGRRHLDNLHRSRGPRRCAIRAPRPRLQAPGPTLYRARHTACRSGL